MLPSPVTAPRRPARADDLARLLLTVGSSRRGAAATAVVTGPAGAGKTWLLDRLVAAARAEGDDPLILRASGHPAEADLPFAGLHQLLDPVLGDLAGLPEPQRHALEGALALTRLPPGDRFAVARGLHRLLADLAERQPVLVVVDDHQWLDTSSSQSLVFAARRLDADRVAVVVAARTPHRPALGGPQETHVELAPLTDGEARHLVRTEHPDAAALVVDAVVEAAAGLPLALREIPTVLTPAQRRAEAALPRPLPVGSTLDRLYQDRLAALDADTSLALVLASAEPLDRAHLDAGLEALGLSAPALEPAERAGLVTLTAAGVAFPHPTVAAAVQGAATASVRDRVHAAVATVLAGHPSRRAHHLHALATGPDDGVADALVAAAEDAERRGAWTEAGHARDAAADRSEDPARRRAQVRRAATAYAFAGASAPLLRSLRELVDGAETDDERLALEHELLAARIWTSTDPVDAAAVRAVADRCAAAAPIARARLLTTLALGLVIDGQTRAAADIVGTARALTGGPADDISLAVSWEVVDLYGGGAGDGTLVSGWDEDLSDAELWDPALPVTAAAATLSWVDAPERARALLHRHLAALRRAGSLGQVGVGTGQLASTSHRSGDWTRARAEFATATRLCVDTDFLGPLPHIQVRHAYLLAAQGAEDECRALVDAAVRAAPGNANVVHLGDCVLGLLALGTGRSAEAVDHLLRARDRERQTGVALPGYSTRAIDLVEALWQVRDGDGAGREADAMAAAAERADRPGPRAVAARARALLADDAEVDRAYGAALAWYARAPDPFEEARTELSWGRRLRRARRKRDARAHLRLALGAFERLGAAPWSVQARSELAACGERRRAGPAVATELTPRELEVAVAVARGASNPEAAAALCISRRTVEDHLGRVYRKLGVRDRAGLAALLGDDPG